MKILTFVAVVSLASVATSAPVLAETRTQSVPVSESALASQSGREAVYARIEEAARAVCKVHGARDLEALRMQRDCTDQAVSDARSQLETRLAGNARPVRMASAG